MEENTKGKSHIPKFIYTEIKYLTIKEEEKRNKRLRTQELKAQRTNGPGDSRNQELEFEKMIIRKK